MQQNKFNNMNSLILNNVPAGEAVRNHKYKIINEQLKLIEQLFSTNSKIYSKKTRNDELKKSISKKTVNLNTESSQSQVII